MLLYFLLKNAHILDPQPMFTKPDPNMRKIFDPTGPRFTSLSPN